MMTNDELPSAVLAMVRERDHVSFAELAREWPEHFRDGPFEIRSSVAPNLVIWVGLSETGAAALEQLQNRTVVYERKQSGARSRETEVEMMSKRRDWALGEVRRQLAEGG